MVARHRAAITLHTASLIKDHLVATAKALPAVTAKGLRVVMARDRPAATVKGRLVVTTLRTPEGRVASSNMADTVRCHTTVVLTEKPGDCM